jgi:hypothetical protein
MWEVKVDRPVSKHLRIQFEVQSSHKVVPLVLKLQRTFVTLHLLLPMSQRLFNSVKKSNGGKHGVFGVRGQKEWPGVELAINIS